MRDASAAVRAWLAGALLALLLASASNAVAQGEPTLSALTLELWPEYDRPGVLVIVRGTLSPEITLPASVTVNVPAASGGPFAVAVQQPDGSLVNTQFVTSAVGGDIAVTLQATAASFQVEYYDTALTAATPDRAFVFDWAPGWRVTAASLRIQEPRGASDLTAQPPVMLAGSSDLGLNYYTASLGALQPGQAVHVELKYVKATPGLSVEETPAEAGLPTVVPAVAVQPATAPALNLPSGPDAWRVWAAGGLVVAALGLGGWGGWLWWRGRRVHGVAPDVVRAPDHQTARPRPAVARVEPAPPTRPAPLPGSTPVERTRAAQNFCTQCGRPLSTTDGFCRQCGAPVRARQNA